MTGPGGPKVLTFGGSASGAPAEKETVMVVDTAAAVPAATIPVTTAVKGVGDLSPADQQAVQALSRELVLDPGKDTKSIIEFGSKAQTSAAGYASAVLGQVRAKDSGEAGKLLTDLLGQCRGIDVAKLKGGKKGWLAGLLNRAKDEVMSIVDQYDDVASGVEKVRVKLIASKDAVLGDIQVLEGLYAKNLETYRLLELYIYAGQMKLEELNTLTIPAARAKADQTKDEMDVQQLQALEGMAQMLDKKIMDLQLTRQVAIQTAPQIKLIQRGNSELAQKMQSSVLNTIPLWLQQFTIAIALARQEQGVKLQEAVDDKTNELLRKNAEMMHTGAVSIAKASQRGIIDVETIQKMTTEFIAAIEETRQIEQEGAAKRITVRAELEKIEGDLKQRLIAA